MREFLVYLAGGISGLTFNEAVEWRRKVRDAVPSNIKTLSPMRGKQRLEEMTDGKAILDTYEENPLTSYKGINQRDYFDVKRSDAIFVNVLGAKTVSIGTVMEVAWARAFEIPVILVMEPGNIHTHSMFTFPCGFIVDTLEKGIEVLKCIIGPDESVMDDEIEILPSIPYDEVEVYHWIDYNGCKTYVPLQDGLNTTNVVQYFVDDNLSSFTYGKVFDGFPYKKETKELKVKLKVVDELKSK